MLSHVGERGEKDWNFEISDLSEKRRKKKKKKCVMELSILRGYTWIELSIRENGLLCKL